MEVARTIVRFGTIVKVGGTIAKAVYGGCWHHCEGCCHCGAIEKVGTIVKVVGTIVKVVGSIVKVAGTIVKVGGTIVYVVGTIVKVVGMWRFLAPL